MAPWLLPIAQSILQAQQQRQEEQEQRKLAQADIAAKRAQSLGFPAYGIQAEATNRELEDKYGSKNYLAALIPLLMSRGNGGGA